MYLTRKEADDGVWWLLMLASDYFGNNKLNNLSPKIKKDPCWLCISLSK